eukprot:g791.t1
MLGVDEARMSAEEIAEAASEVVLAPAVDPGLAHLRMLKETNATRLRELMDNKEEGASLAALAMGVPVTLSGSLGRILLDLVKRSEMIWVGTISPPMTMLEEEHCSRINRRERVGYREGIRLNAPRAVTNELPKCLRHLTEGKADRQTESYHTRRTLAQWE